MDRFGFDLRWKYAAGGLDFDYPSFVHTVLVEMRARLRRSERPNRIFEKSLEVARSAGLVGRKRVLDSTPLYDAVATQDTVTLIRAAIRGLLRVADENLGGEVRQVLRREDDYSTAGKPACDWDDKVAREDLIDALARDAHAALLALDGRQLSGEMKAAAELLATVVGQDLEQTEAGLFRIARRVAADRVISTVDPEARHGHKTAARGFDGYKGHIAIDPDSELITAIEVTAGNVGDASAAAALLAEVLPVSTTPTEPAPPEAKPASEMQQQVEQRPDAPARMMGEQHSEAGPQGPLSSGPRHRHGDVPGRPASLDSPAQRRRGHCELRTALCWLSDARPMHDIGGWSQRKYPPTGETPGGRTRATEEPRMETEVQSDPTEGRAEARTPDASEAWRSPGARARAHPRGPGLRPAGRGHQLCSPSGAPRTGLSRRIPLREALPKPSS